jgi:hypothetical protein
MFKKSLSLLGAALACAPLLAQTPAAPPAPVVGKTAEVKGLVTVSHGTNVRTVTGTVPVMDGSRFVTASTGFAVIRFDDGCDVKLEPNQAYTVESEKPCAARVASVQGLPGGAGSVFAGVDALRPLLAIGLYAGGVVALDSIGGSGTGALGGGGVTPNPPTDPGGGGTIPNQCISPPCP